MADTLTPAEQDAVVFVGAIVEKGVERGALGDIMAGLHAGLALMVEDPSRGIAALHRVEAILAELHGETAEDIEVRFRVPIREARRVREQDERDDRADREGKHD